MSAENSNLVPFPGALKVAVDSARNAPIETHSLERASPFSSENSMGGIARLAADELGVDASQQGVSSQVFSVYLEDFDGPIDLLLHLVKRNELPIEKLSLAKVADQYLQCINQSIGFDLELAGEYLVIAATLLSIKAALLLDPKADRQLHLDEGPDPHEELLRRLREAEVYQEAARLIGTKNLLGIDVFSPAVSHTSSKIQAEDPGLALHDSALLARALRKILAAVPSPIGMVINWNRISIAERMQFVVEHLQMNSNQRVSFEDLVGESPTLPIVVSSFIALLELCKRQVIQITQGAYQDCITISLIAQAGLSAEVLSKSEFDAEMIDVAMIDEDSRKVGNIS